MYTSHYSVEIYPTTYHYNGFSDGQAKRPEWTQLVCLKCFFPQTYPHTIKKAHKLAIDFAKSLLVTNLEARVFVVTHYDHDKRSIHEVTK